MADWVSTVRRGVRRALSQFTSTIQIVERAAGTGIKNEAHAGALRLDTERTERRREESGRHGRCLHGRGVCATLHVSQTLRHDEHDCLY